MVPDVPLNNVQSFHERKANRNDENAFNNSINDDVISDAADQPDNDEMILMADDIKHLHSNVIAKRIVHTSNQLYRVLIKNW